MRLLLDTHAFLWYVFDQPELSAKARRALAGARNEVLVSLASFWEIASKVGLGKLELRKPFEHFVPEHMAANGFGQLDMSFRHIARMAALPSHHRDPFDRLLIAQALEENLTILGADRHFDAYGVKRIW
jgi:PIN domain nuclease of toxin-antitoxin system